MSPLICRVSMKSHIHNLECSGLLESKVWLGSWTSNIKPRLTYPVAGDRGLRVQVLGRVSESTQSGVCSLAITLSLECRINTNARSPLGLRQRSGPHFFPVVSNRHLFYDLHRSRISRWFCGRMIFKLQFQSGMPGLHTL